MMFVSSPTGNSGIISHDDLEETGNGLQLKTYYTSQGFGFTDSNLQGGGVGGSYARHNTYNNYASLYLYSQEGVTVLNRSVYTLISIDLNYLVSEQKEEEATYLSLYRDERIGTLLDSSFQRQPRTKWVIHIFGAAFASDGFAYFPGTWVQEDVSNIRHGFVERFRSEGLPRPETLGTSHASVEAIRWGARIMPAGNNSPVHRAPTKTYGGASGSTHPSTRDTGMGLKHLLMFLGIVIVLYIVFMLLPTEESS